MKKIILLTYCGELYGKLCGDYTFMKEGLDQLCEKLNDFEGINEFVEIMRELEKTGDFPFLKVVLDRLCKRGYAEKIDEDTYFVHFDNGNCIYGNLYTPGWNSLNLD